MAWTCCPGRQDQLEVSLGSGQNEEGQTFTSPAPTAHLSTRPPMHFKQEQNFRAINTGACMNNFTVVLIMT